MHSLNSRRASNRKLRAGSILSLALTLGAGASAMAAGSGVDTPHVAVASDQATPKQLANARFLGRQNPQTPIDIEFMLPLRNRSALDALLRRIYDPKDPLYRQYLTSSEFDQQFGPTQEDYDAVLRYAQSVGLSVVSQTPSRTLLHVRGTTDAVESALGVRFDRYLMPDGRVSYAAQGIPSMPKDVVARISGVVGLDNLALHHPHLASNALTKNLKTISSHATGPAGHFAPADIRTAYNVPTTVQGEGQSVALYELEGYKASDVTTFTTQFGQPPATLTNVFVDGYTGTIQTVDNQIEVILDIDMVLTMAPNIGNIYVYQAKRQAPDALDLWQKIADDNLSKVVSTSWGLAETEVSAAQRTAENDIFTKMKAQGQTVFDASGDGGAFDDTTGLAVDDPGSQPLVTGVGGTALTTGLNGVYGSEVVWNAFGSASGGGISTVWAKPDYQLNFQGGAPGTTTTFREVPDVALNADPQTGYDIFVNDAGGWFTEGGTSAAAPLWAGFTALVNQQLGLSGSKPIGFINPSLYGIAANSSNYAKAFHDITVGNNDSGSTSATGYDAKVGYDDATGLGTFNAGELFKQLAITGGKSPGTITGLVTDNNNQPIDTTGTPVAGAVTVTATITATNTVAATTTTKPEGTYTLNLLTDVTYTLSFDAAGYAGPVISNVVIPSSGTGAGTLTENEIMTPSHTFPAGLQMISYPAEFGSVGDFSKIFGLANDPPASTDPALFIYAPTQNTYVKTPTYPADTMHNGAGYWVRFSTPMPLHRIGVPAPLISNFIPLQPGWNMVGNPFPAAVNVSQLRIAETNAPARSVPFASSTSIGDGKLNNVMWTYPVGGGTYPGSAYNAVNATGTYKVGKTTGAASTTFEPYAGYWIFANTNCLLEVPPPAN